MMWDATVELKTTYILVTAYDLTPSFSVAQNITLNYNLPLLGKSSSTGTQKLPLCFLEDATYAKWLEVFDAWEQGKLIGVATQDRVFPYYVPNSSIKHSKSDSKDRSQEIL
jgi:hypothetical protein